MSVTKRIVYGFVAVVLLGILLLFNFNVIQDTTIFGYSLRTTLQYLFMVPFIYYAVAALFPRMIFGSNMSAIIGIAVGAVIYTMLANLPSWSWNTLAFRFVTIVIGGFVVWLISGRK